MALPRSDSGEVFAPGQLVAGRYRLIRLLGEGGMGSVWAATNEAISRDVAIKVMRPQIADDPSALQRFFNEARICGSIRHPGIVDVLDLGRAEDGSPFLVMERLEGDTLDRRLERVRLMLPSTILPIVRDVARTIALAHERNVIHRDLKPANIFLHRAGAAGTIIKVLDFGISKILTPGSGAKTTQTGLVVGSPAYMSPEHALGKVSVDARTDVYAIGVILYEALTGRMPFEGENYNALIVDIATKDPADIALVAPHLPASVVALVRDAMARDRDQRIPSMAELERRIDAILPAMPEEESRMVPVEPPAPVMATSESSGAQRTASVLTSSVREQPSTAKAWLSIAIGASVSIGLSAALFLAFVKKPAQDPAPVAPITTEARAPGTQGAAQPNVSLAPPAASTAAEPVAPAPSSSESAEPAASVAPTASASAAPSSSASAGAKPKAKLPVTPKKKEKGAWGYD